ncbi:hypothetical protein L6452_19858 [Arctium lappa]|uniref:Uncharacterized protein n=1 Tax=Arctium lappa TaxID=4217 RepID=A0ACB9BAL2_ARCLA|nr:hypothetical protein L6452_19858 [Arctium lappa]
MLAVFEKTVAKSPEGLQTPQQDPSVNALKDGLLSRHFASLHPSVVAINLADSGLISYSIDKQNPLLPRDPTIRSITAETPSQTPSQIDHLHLWNRPSQIDPMDT